MMVIIILFYHVFLVLERRHVCCDGKRARIYLIAYNISSRFEQFAKLDAKNKSFYRGPNAYGGGVQR